MRLHCLPASPLQRAVVPALPQTGPAPRRPRAAPARAQQQRRGGPDAGDKIKLDVFETAGTPDDRSGWEPFSALPFTLDTSEPMSFDGEEKTEYDPLRDGPLRYLGYANELGEAFAAWLFAGGVPLSYAVAVGYVLFDTFDKYRKTLADAETKLSARKLPPSVDVGRLVAVIGAERGIDTLVWQLIASVAAPGYTIHTVVALVTAGLVAAEAQPGVAGAAAGAAAALGVDPAAFLETVNKSVPTAAGLAAIPFIVHPIDGGVHALLNATLRPALRRVICSSGGAEAGLAVCDDCAGKRS